MSDLPQKISRDEFYERIWSTPIVQLGKALGYSYPEMIKLCEALNVPRPEAGYWYRRKHGGPEEKAPLPPAGVNTPTEIELKSTPRDPVPPENREIEASTPISVEEAPPAEVVEQSKGETPPKSSPSKVTEQKVPSKVQYTRDQLYEAIWTTSCQKLAASLGISDVALAKSCKRLGIPRPSLGYWARVAAGEKVPRIPLPAPKEGQKRTLIFDVAANLSRRKEWKATQSNLEELAVELELPADESALHPRAQKHLQTLQKKKPAESGLIHVDQRDLFQCDVTPSNVSRLCRAIHALIVELEARGYTFKAGTDEYSNLQIVNENDALTIWCTEGYEEIQREPTAQDKRRPSWTWQLKQTLPTGKLSFEVHTRGLRGRRTWSESNGRPLEEVLGIVVEKVGSVFRGFEDERKYEAEAAKRREEEAERAAEEQAREEKLAAKRERVRRHQAKLSEIIDTRRENLRAAAQQWVEAGYLQAFIDSCESRWRQSGELSENQLKWLVWAREEAANLLPLAKGYPDPAVDGRFDPGNVPMGGPYPKVKALKEKAAEQPVPVEVQREVRTVYVKEPYPYWALHPKH